MSGKTLSNPGERCLLQTGGADSGQHGVRAQSLGRRAKTGTAGRFGDGAGEALAEAQGACSWHKWLPDGQTSAGRRTDRERCAGGCAGKAI